MSVVVGEIISFLLKISCFFLAKAPVLSLKLIFLSPEGFPVLFNFEISPSKISLMDILRRIEI